jgi:hypothetical protein
MLHITNGDVVAGKLREARLPGEVSVSADVLHEGPCPTTADVTDFREARARYLADAGYAPYDQALETLVQQDAALHAARGQDEVVLWFEHDLFDQLQLLRVLAWFARYGLGRASLTLICIGSFPGLSRFAGLGQLTIAQLAGLFPAREPVTARHLERAADAWQRFGADTPVPFAALLDEDTSDLPYLAGAVRRELEELPSTRNGLSRTEHQALAAVAAGAPDILVAFHSTQEMEERVFLGDLSFARAVRTLAAAGLPLVDLDPPGEHVPLARQAVALTALGRQVLAAQADHARLNGVDRWVGGVHLRGRNPAWRWDADGGAIVGADESHS